MKPSTLIILIQVIAWPIVLCIIGSVLYNQFNGAAVLKKLKEFKQKSFPPKTKIKEDQKYYTCIKCKEEGNEIKIPYESVEDLHKQIEIHNKQVHQIGDDKNE